VQLVARFVNEINLVDERFTFIFYLEI